VNSTTKPVLLGSAKQRKLQRSSEGLQLLGVASGLFPLLALLADGAAANLSSLEAVASLVNRASALVGTSLLLVHLVLVARVPWIEAVFGLDKLTGAHKKLSKPLVFILGLHVASSIYFYALQNEAGVFKAALDLVGGYLEMLMAFIGFAMMLLVTFSSITAARRLLSYEVWYLIHLLSYIAVLLAIPHQFAFGSTFLAQPWIGTYFGALYIFVLVNVVWFRSLYPVIRALAGGFKVSSLMPSGNNSTSVTVRGKGLARLPFKSGQFFMVRVMTLRDFWKPHPFSASNSSGDGYLRFTIGNRGDFTARMQTIPIGTRIVLEGPYGVFTEAKRSRQKVTLIAAGIGVAPIRSLAQQLASKPGDLTIIYRANTGRDAALANELVEISEKRGHRLKILTGPRDRHVPWHPEQRVRTKQKPDYILLSELAPDILESDIYICGPSQWTSALIQTVSKLSIPKHQIHIEEFAW
jgi:predicted ferric reductase